MPAVIAPLPTAHNNDDSSDDEDDNATNRNDVTSKRHHHRHHGHKLNGAVQEGFEGEGFSSDAKPYDLEQGGGLAAGAAAAAGGSGWQQQQQRQVLAADSCDSAAADVNGSYYLPMAGGLRQPYESGEGLRCA
jgi:hypothetical protein